MQYSLDLSGNKYWVDFEAIFFVSQGVYATLCLDDKRKINNTKWRKKSPKDAISYFRQDY
jgi:hypothetical protein